MDNKEEFKKVEPEAPKLVRQQSCADFREHFWYRDWLKAKQEKDKNDKEVKQQYK